MSDSTLESNRPEVEHLWQRAHRELTSVAKEKAAVDYREARCILAALNSGVHRMLGFGSFSEYLERFLGYSPRMTQEKIRVAEALEALPRLATLLRDGALSWSMVRLLSRVANSETEVEWIELTRGSSVREVERLIAGRAIGDRPDDPVKPELLEHVIYAKVLPQTMALWRQAIVRVTKDAGGSLTEDEAIQMIARIALEGPADEGRASHQIVISKCEDCGRIAQRGAGEDVVVSEHVFAAASCDAQVLNLRDGEEARAKQDIRPAIRRFVLLRDRRRCAVPGCRHTAFLDIHHSRARHEGGDDDPEFLVTLCGAHHPRAHDGRLVIEGRASTGFIFKHADGTPYGSTEVSPILAGKLSDQFNQLVDQGLTESEAKTICDRMREPPPHGTQ